MTRKEIIYELYNLSFADDVPIRYKPIITKIIDTIMDAPPNWPAPIRTLKDEGTFSTLLEAKAQAEKLAARAVEEDRRKCDVCPLLHNPEFRVQGGKIDIVERCGASGYPIGCVSADYYCKIEEMKRRREE